MKKTILICVLMAFCAGTALAGDSTDVKDKTDKATEKATCEKVVKEVAPDAATPDKADKADKADKTEKKEFEIITTKSGLQYIVYEEGDGEVAEKGMTVKVHYTGWLSDKGEKGTKFDSSHDRKTPLPFRLGAGRVIRGWEEGIEGMKVGGKRQLIIPPQLGYGNRAMGNVIPANSTLIFDVELVGVSK